MVIAGDFKNGVTFEMEGNVMQIIEFQHVKPGKGAGVRTHEAQKRHYGCRYRKNLFPYR